MPFSIYQNRTVTLALLAIFLTGFGMFGGIIFVPLFFQGVLGASATNSGAFLTPMMLGMVFGAAVSGQTLSRLGGHYRLQGLIGAAIMGTGIALASRMTADTGYVQAVVNIVVMGIGLGVTFPGYTIAVQNAVPYRVVGVATLRNPVLPLYRGHAGPRRARLGDDQPLRYCPGRRNATAGRRRRTPGVARSVARKPPNAG